MPDILHRISIDASTDRVHDLIASTEGVGRWWTGRPLEGSTAVGDRFGVYVPGADEPAAVMRVVADTPEQITWRVEQGPIRGSAHASPSTSADRATRPRRCCSATPAGPRRASS